MVIDGSVGLVGSHRDEVNAAIARAKQSRLTGPDVSVGKDGENVAIRIGSGNGNGKVLLVGFDHEHTSKLGRCENGGRTRAESNVVPSLSPGAEWSGRPVNV